MDGSTIAERARQEAADIAAVKKDSSVLGRLPEPRRTKKVRQAALGIDGMAMQYIPERMQTASEAALAIMSNFLSAGFIKPELLERPAVQTALRRCCDPFDEQHAEVMNYVRSRIRMAHAPESSAAAPAFC